MSFSKSEDTMDECLKKYKLAVDEYEKKMDEYDHRYNTSNTIIHTFPKKPKLSDYIVLKKNNYGSCLDTSNS